MQRGEGADSVGRGGGGQEEGAVLPLLPMHLDTWRHVVYMLFFFVLFTAVFYYVLLLLLYTTKKICGV
jgi:hypothetical protein